MNNPDPMAKFMLMRNTAGPVSVSFDITSDCNLRCVHCLNNSGASSPREDLSAAQKLDVARQIATLRPQLVCLCGGETLCCGNLLDIVDALYPHTGKIGMVSNGYALTAEKARQLKAHGVHHVQISVDGANAWQHDTFRGVAGSFDRAVNALRFLKDAGIPQTYVSLVPNKLNFRSLKEYAGLCRSLGVNTIRAMPFLPSGRGRSVGRSLMLDEQEYFEFCRALVRLKGEYAGRLEFEWGDPLDHLRRMAFNAEHGLHTYVMEIKSDGALAATPYLPIVFGSCKKQTLKEYWDAGYNRIWEDKRFTSLTEKVQNIYDLDTFEPRPYGGDNIYIGIMEGAQ